MLGGLLRRPMRAFDFDDARMGQADTSIRSEPSSLPLFLDRAQRAPLRVQSGRNPQNLTARTNTANNLFLLVWVSEGVPEFTG